MKLAANLGSFLTTGFFRNKCLWTNWLRSAKSLWVFEGVVLSWRSGISPEIGFVFERSCQAISSGARGDRSLLCEVFAFSWN
jgi:hypothetical protein